MDVFTTTLHVVVLPANKKLIVNIIHSHKTNTKYRILTIHHCMTYVHNVFTVSNKRHGIQSILLKRQSLLMTDMFNQAWRATSSLFWFVIRPITSTKKHPELTGWICIYRLVLVHKKKSQNSPRQIFFKFIMVN